MKDEYIKNYVEGQLLRLSLDALWRHLSWPPAVEDALTMTQWGPFYLTGTNAPFVATFIRTADRSLFHAGNVWRGLVDDLLNAQHVLPHLQDDAVAHTHDRSSKYEIEAFLGAARGITEANLIGSKKGNRLGRSVGLGGDLIARIRQEAESFHQTGVQKKWHDVRNSAYHLNPGMSDWGYAATIRMRDGVHAVELFGVHYVEGAPADLVQVFSETFLAFTAFVTRVRDLLLEFSFREISVPKNSCYYSSFDKLGNMLVGLGPNGFECRHSPETASDFVGPIRGT